MSDQTIGRATSVTEVVATSPAVSRTTNYQYDGQRRLQKVTNPEGDYTQLTYDARGNVTQQLAAAKPGSGLANITTSAAYPATCTNPVTCNQPTSTTDALGRTTNYTYDPVHGGVLTVTAPAPSTGAARPQTRVTYAAQTARYKNASGALVNGSPITLPVSSSTCVTGSSCAGTANEVKTNITYGPASGANNLLPTVVSTGAGDGSLTATTTLTYTANGDMATVDGPLPGTADASTYRYDAARRVVGMIGPDPDGAGPLLRRAQRITYDARGNVTLAEQGTVTGTTDSNWAAFASLQKSAVVYDTYGRPVQQRQQSGSTTHSLVQISYDAAGRVDCTAQRMNAATFGAPPVSACTLGAAGAFGPDRISKNTYDNAGQLLSTTSGFGTSDTIVERATYNLSGQPVSLTDGKGNASVIEYDGFGRMAKMRYPNASGGGTSTTDYEQYTYNVGSLVTQHRMRSGQSVSYSYDGLNRVTLADATAANDIGYTYDNLGRALTAFGGGQTLTMTYDALGRQLTQTSPLGTVTSDYDLAGRRTRLWWPDGYHVNYDYNTVGDLVSMREYGVTNWYLAAWNHDNLGRRTQMTRSNGANTAWSYDNAGRLAQLSHDLPGTADDQTFNFSYNPAGQIVNRTISNTAYVYAPAVGSVSYANNGRNQVASVGGTAVTYDAAQNITGAPTGTYSYDGLNRLQSSNAGGGASWYTYDPASRLYQIDTTRFLYDGARPMAEYDASGNVLRRHIPGLAMDETLLTYEGAGILDRRYLIADERLSVTAITDPLGNILSRNTYDEYGQPGANNAGRFQYTGQMWLPNAQAYHYKARVYAPQLGRFMQTDPIGYGDGPNLYAYVGADPINMVDPWGLCQILSMEMKDGSTGSGGSLCEVRAKRPGSIVSGGGRGGGSGGGGGGGGGGSSGASPTDSDECPKGGYTALALSPNIAGFVFIGGGELGVNLGINRPHEGFWDLTNWRGTQIFLQGYNNRLGGLGLQLTGGLGASYAGTSGPMVQGSQVATPIGAASIAVGWGLDLAAQLGTFEGGLGDLSRGFSGSGSLSLNAGLGGYLGVGAQDTNNWGVITIGCRNE